MAFDNKRYDATPGFIYFRGNLSHTQTLRNDIQLYGRATLQLTPDALVSSEQISLGGLDTVRGYLESETLGDYGGAVQFEMRSPSLADTIGWRLNELRGFGFFDWARR